MRELDKTKLAVSAYFTKRRDKNWRENIAVSVWFDGFPPTIVLTMLRFVCLFLAAGILSAEAMQIAETLKFDVGQLAELPCPNTPWVDSAYFLLADTGFGDPTCEYYMELDLREKIEEFCKRSPGACSFRLANILGREPDPSCVSSFHVGYLCI